MNNIIDIETERRIIQNQIDKSRTKLYRNKLGQYATPNELAIEITTFTRSLIESKEKINFLEPALGTGSFFSALLQVFNPEEIEKSFGIEIDEKFASEAERLWSPKGLTVINADFTKLKTLNNTFNLLITNPPYVRHHHLNEHQKKELVDFAKHNLNIKISKLAGFYCHFILHSHNYLKDNGIAVWLVPNEFLDVNYGTAIKQYLLNHVKLIRIHRFKPENTVFSDALVSSLVLWYKKEKPTVNNEIKFTYGNSINFPEKEIFVKGEELEPSIKWTKFFTECSVINSNHNNLKIKDLFEIKRGIATGSNNFFILSKKEIEDKNLPIKFFKPILPSPRFINHNIIEPSDNNQSLYHNYFVLDCKLGLQEIKYNYNTLYQYIKQGESKGISSGYICRNRNPWYSQERREKPLFICNYIGRENSTKAFRFILNKSSSIVTNSYLGIYPKPIFNRIQESVPDLSFKILDFLNDTPSDEFIKKGRVYGGGMYKLEPKELENVEITLPISIQQYINTFQQLTLFESTDNYSLKKKKSNRKK